MTWKPEPIPTVRDKPGTKTKTGRTKPDTQAEWLGRSFRKISTWTAGIQAQVDALGGIITYGASITDDAGDGTAHGDLNATDFTGHPHAIGTALEIKSNAVVTFGHKAVAYIWQGQSGVTVGVGGSYTAASTDLVPIGTADHSILVNRTLADAHPTSSITNLDSEQQQQNTDITQNANTIANHIGNLSNPHQVNHSQLPDVDPDTSNPHPQYQLKKPIMLLGGTADSFTLNSTDSKLENYSLSAEANTTGSIDPINGEITIPATGVYSIGANVLGLQGNNTKEEWIELKIDVDGVDRVTAGFLDVTTDKTSTRQVITFATRQFTAGDVLSLYMWASSGLGTFTVSATAFEVAQLA